MTIQETKDRPRETEERSGIFTGLHAPSKKEGILLTESSFSSMRPEFWYRMLHDYHQKQLECNPIVY